MAQILRQGPTGDGYDVLAATADESVVLHFSAPVTAEQRDAAIADYIARRTIELRDAEIAANMQEIENG